MYGMRKAEKHHRCFVYNFFNFIFQESKNYLEQCIDINKFIANDKKYYPERYATSEFQHVQPHHSSVFIPK